MSSGKRPGVRRSMAGRTFQDAETIAAHKPKRLKTNDKLTATLWLSMDPWVAILIGAAGTWTIALIAIGAPIFRLAVKPRLRVERNGFSATTATHTNGRQARYYFVRIKNRWRRVSPAHEVQLVNEQGQQGHQG